MEKPFHYFVATAFGYATSGSLRKAIKLLRESGSAASPFGAPIHMFAYRVNLPPTTPYNIKWYRPDVDLDKLEDLHQCFGSFS